MNPKVFDLCLAIFWFAICIGLADARLVDAAGDAREGNGPANAAGHRD